MKTQIARSSLAAVFFPVFPAETGKSGGVNGRSSDSRLDFPPRLEPIRAKRISIREPVPRDHSGLPASLEDWLASDAARVISRKVRAGTEDARPARINPAAIRV